MYTSHELDFLYRFRSDNQQFTIDELQNSYVYFQGKDKLNDPFDCYPDLIGINPDSQNVRDYVRSELDKIFPNLEKFKTDILEETIGLLKKDNSISKFAQPLINKLADTIGIACFTTDLNNLLMWSHYASFHRGICLKFNTSSDKTFFDGAAKVRYTKKFKRIDINLEHGKEMESFEHMILTKSDIWSSENEIRLTRIKQGKYSYKRDALNAIIFGIQTDETFKKKIIEATFDLYPQVKYMQAIPLKNEFGIDLVKYQ